MIRFGRKCHAYETKGKNSSNSTVDVCTTAAGVDYRLRLQIKILSILVNIHLIGRFKFNNRKTEVKIRPWKKKKRLQTPPSQRVYNLDLKISSDSQTLAKNSVLNCSRHGAALFPLWIFWNFVLFNLSFITFSILFRDTDCTRPDTKHHKAKRLH